MIMKGMPEKLQDYAIYNDSNALVGSADITLPDLEYLTDTISGAGIAGEIDSPTVGQFKSMELTIKWRSITGDVAKLLAPIAHHLDIRASVQRFNKTDAKYDSYPEKIVVRAIPKKGGLGKFEPGKSQDNENTFEVIYIKVWVDGKEVIEIDKHNYIAKIDGTDYLADVRKHLGLS
jgi:P2 family phage contractile tail tube protein